jgi:hypothetical protein
MVIDLAAPGGAFVYTLNRFRSTFILLCNMWADLCGNASLTAQDQAHPQINLFDVTG